ncbi:MAG: condensation domain-containing protein, partial [Flavobacteriales bacterium]
MDTFIPAIKTETVEYDPFAGPAIERCFSTTESQREVIASSQMGDDASCAYNESITLELSGGLDQVAMKDALHHVIMRHDSLRSTFTGNGTRMVVAAEDPTLFDLLDLSAFNAEEREHMLSAIDEADMTMTFDLQKGPLFRSQLIRIAADQHLLRLSAHHVICDGWSLA